MIFAFGVIEIAVTVKNTLNRSALLERSISTDIVQSKQAERIYPHKQLK